MKKKAPISQPHSTTSPEGVKNTPSAAPPRPGAVTNLHEQQAHDEGATLAVSDLPVHQRIGLEGGKKSQNKYMCEQGDRLGHHPCLLWEGNSGGKRWLWQIAIFFLVDNTSCEHDVALHLDFDPKRLNHPSLHSEENSIGKMRSGTDVKRGPFVRKGLSGSKKRWFQEFVVETKPINN